MPVLPVPCRLPPDRPARPKPLAWPRWALIGLAALPLLAGAKTPPPTTPDPLAGTRRTSPGERIVSARHPSRVSHAVPLRHATHTSVGEVMR